MYLCVCVHACDCQGMEATDNETGKHVVTGGGPPSASVVQMRVSNYRLELASIPRENAYLACSSLPTTT